MNVLKLILIAVAIVLAAFVALAVVGVAISLLRSLFWLAVICVVVALLWKMFGPKGGDPEPGGEAQNKLPSAELTLEEYKRKIESQWHDRK